MATDEFAGNGAEMQVHTPGPWHVVDDGDESAGHSAIRIHFDGQDGEYDEVAEVSYRGPNSRAELLANAHLIAAAPDLLDAAVRILRLPAVKKELSYLDRGIGTATENGVWLDLRAALRKAGVTDNG